MRKLLFVETDRKTGAGTRAREPKIRCPKCKWEPKKHDRWFCLCGHTWNTFDTHGLCPGCDAQWKETACLSCHQWSLHDDWYADDSDGTT